MMYGVMLDCSRNGVMTVQTVKKYAEILSRMGYNTLMLYTEDTFEVDDEPFFGYRRGRYSKAELKELDAYCNSIGIELIPCVQMLAHLNCMFKWETYRPVWDCDDILLIGEEKTYQLLDHIFSSISQCFTSRKIHIGMDEANKVGLGKYLEKNGYEKRFDIINRHLHLVCDMARKYDFEPMIWSDMFCKLALNSDTYEVDDPREISKIRERAALPENVSLVYWSYSNTDYNQFVNMIKLNKAFEKKVYFAGGAWTWKGFAPDNTFSMEATKAAMKACRDCGIDGWFMTVWGDDGDECSKFTMLPTLLYAIETAKGNTDIEDMKKKFRDIVGADFDAFMLLDQLDTIGGRYGGNPSKYYFYNDSFLGLNDYRASEENNLFYSKLAEKIKNADGKGAFESLFEMYEKLCQVLAVKCDLGVRTRAYYQEGDKQALKKLAGEEYNLTIERVKAFHKAYQNLWLQEKKPHGFDVQDIRIGGVIQRLASCQERILAYVNGEVTNIPELEEKLLPDNCGHVWSRLVTANVVSHVL